MNTDQLRYFMVLANYKNYSVAAEHLFISQSSLSRHISTFENEIGAKLFIRKNNGVDLTAAGKYLYKRAPKLFEEIQKLQVGCRSIGDGITGIFTLALAEDQQVNPWIVSAITSFQQTRPDVSIVLHSYTQEQIISSLSSCDADLALVVEYYSSDYPCMQTFCYAQDQTVLIVPKYHENSQIKEISLGEISDMFSDLTLFVNEPSIAYWTSLLQKFMPHSGAIDLWPMILQSTTNLTIAAGLGMTLRNRWSNIHANDTTRIIPVVDMLPKLRLSAVYNPKNVNAFVEEFLPLLGLERDALPLTASNKQQEV